MKQDKLFIDTGAWIALIQEKDQFHERASSFLKSLDFSVKRVSSSYVIAETYTWLRYRAGVSYANQFLGIIEKSKQNGTLNIILDHNETLQLAEQLLKDFPDQKLSYVDAVSMAIMKTEQIQKVFGFDRHFYLLKFEIVP
ncbi:PIN domain-containing protein [Lederbergia sp. NSJ-179]|uniref:type II toxin-antitoxin system VapC family toxin n=1 Tax=Lederbergia sp. NSJ-179 TaxID=2931402 RepID=UPI001FD1EC82|nr:PIN domain-containing protein [Lederbergia sp. NSJ-179]MCJ7841121.1 PIN domain-containing protein [Lederbergia sp. NSJ-179]